MFLQVMKKLLFFVFALCCLYPAMGQNRNIIVLGGKQAAGTKRYTKKVYPSMAVKLAALNFISGNLPICFEKERNNVALLVGAGPTFRRFYNSNLLGSLFDEGQEVYSWGKKDELYGVYNPFDSFEPSRQMQYGLGYYLVACPRYYYNEEGLDGPYIGVQVAVSQYNYKSRNYYETAFDKEGRDRFTDVMVLWGAQYGGDRLVFEWFTGAGIRFRDQQRYAYGFDGSNNLVEGTASIKKASIRFELGMRIGAIF